MRIAVGMRLTAFVVAMIAISGMIAKADYVETLTGMSDLISYWDLNEASGITAADQITTDMTDGDNPGFYSGFGITVGQAGPRPADGFRGFADTNNAPLFSDPYYDVLQMASYAGYEGKTDLTLMGWMRFSSMPPAVTGHFGGLERITPDGSNRYVFAAHHYEDREDMRPRVRVTDGLNEGGTYNAFPWPVDTNWHFFVMTLESGATLRSYVDGYLVDENPIAQPMGLVQPTGLVFGHDIDFYYGIARGMTGQLDELAFVDRAISAGEVQQLWKAAVYSTLGTTATAPYRDTLTNLGGLRNHWRLDEASGTDTLVDSVAGNHITLHNLSGFDVNLGQAAPQPGSGFPGMPAGNRSTQFIYPDGENYGVSQDGGVVGAPGTGLSFAGGEVTALTMSFWFKNHYDGNGYIAGFERSSETDRYIFTMYSPTGTEVKFYVLSDNEMSLATDPITIDSEGDYTWHHLVQVWDGTERRLQVYVDGLERWNEVGIMMNSALAVPDGFYIGRDQLGDTRSLGGFIDEISLFDRALSAEEVYELFDSAYYPNVRTPGDANNDGVVNKDDAARLAAHWLFTSGVGWEEGDFNDDGRVDDLDASILAANWTPDGGEAVPEPSALGLLAGLVICFGVRRMRRRRL
ncbi:MAG: hypothetical protein JW888_17185 [Pirellulales bacterium]|nr:hypothetical protein [Pirellulales bacterium]